MAAQPPLGNLPGMLPPTVPLRAAAQLPLGNPPGMLPLSINDAIRRERDDDRRPQVFNADPMYQPGPPAAVQPAYGRQQLAPAPHAQFQPPPAHDQVQEIFQHVQGLVDQNEIYRAQQEAEERRLQRVRELQAVHEYDLAEVQRGAQENAQEFMRRQAEENAIAARHAEQQREAHEEAVRRQAAAQAAARLREAARQIALQRPAAQAQQPGHRHALRPTPARVQAQAQPQARAQAQPQARARSQDPPQADLLGMGNVQPPQDVQDAAQQALAFALALPVPQMNGGAAQNQVPPGQPAGGAGQSIVPNPASIGFTTDMANTRDVYDGLTSGSVAIVSGGNFNRDPDRYNGTPLSITCTTNGDLYAVNALIKKSLKLGSNRYGIFVRVDGLDDAAIIADIKNAFETGSVYDTVKAADESLNQSSGLPPRPANPLDQWRLLLLYFYYFGSTGPANYRKIMWTAVNQVPP